MIIIYYIEDMKGLKYVGSTEKTLNERLNKHKNNKNVDRETGNCSSEKLDLDNCKIYSLETCNKSNRKQRERYWINNTNCVNDLKLNFVKKEYMKTWDEEARVFRWKRVTNGCYEFLKMLEEY
tara:strand:- start:60 stop:428 length:369 start_codon:yes stop_codon:yes gene_type:complete